MDETEAQPGRSAPIGILRLSLLVLFVGGILGSSWVAFEDDVQAEPPPDPLLPTLAGLAAGRVVAWGENSEGATNVPPSLTNAVVIGTSSTSVDLYAIRADGALVGWGGGARVPAGLSNLVAISSGWNHTIGLKNDGTVVAWGRDNGFGQQSVPAGLNGVKAIAAAANYSLALRTNGTVVGWRADPFSQLSNVVAVAAGDAFALALLPDGRVVGSTGANVPEDLTDVIAIAASSGHGLALRRDGHVVGWGNNSLGQAFAPRELSQVVAITASGDHSLALKRNGTLAAWGDNGYGLSSLGQGLTNVVAIGTGPRQNFAIQTGPVIVSAPRHVLSPFGLDVTFSVVAMASAPMQYQWYFNGTVVPGATNPDLTLRGVQSDEAGDYTVVITSGGVSVWATARLAFGTLPQILVPPQNETVLAGAEVTFSVSATNQAPLLYQWQHEGIDIAQATNSTLSLKEVGLLDGGQYTVRVRTTLGRESTAAAVLNVMTHHVMGRVITWGSGPTNAPAGLSGVIAISAGESHTLALRADGTVAAWGDNAFGQSTIPPGLRNVRAIAAGGHHSLALKHDGSLVAWGYNYNGQATPPPVGDMMAVAAGGSHSLAVRSNGTVLAWGNNTADAVIVPAGLSNVISVAAGDAFSLALSRDGRSVMWGVQNALPPDGLTNIVAIAAGHANYAALRQDGTVADLLNPPPPELTNAIAVATHYGRSVAATSAGTVIGWGWNNIGLRVPPAHLTNIFAVAVGMDHHAALEETGVLIAAAPEDVAVLEGSNVTFRVRAAGVSPLSYQWQFNGQARTGATNPTFTLQPVQLTDAGAYDVVVRSPRGFEVSTSGTLTVLSKPFIVQQPLGTSVLAGSSVTLTVSAGGTPPLQYLWAFDGINISGANRTSLSWTNISRAEAGDYRVRIYNAFGSATSTVASVVVNYPPLVSTVPSYQRILVGSNITFAASATGTPPLFYQWRLDGRDLAGAHGSQLLIEDGQPEDAGIYSLVVTNAFGAVSNIVATLEIMPLHPSIVMQPADQIALVDSTVRFNSMATGVPPLLYQWLFQERPLSGATQASLTLPAVDADNAGDYRLLVTNAFGSTVSSAATLTVRLRPNVVVWGGSNSAVFAVPWDLTNAVQVSAGVGHIVALRSDGTVTAWGMNSSGQTNVPAGLSNITSIVAGDEHNLALAADGQVFAWGANQYGQATVPVTERFEAIACGSLHSIGVRSNGTVAHWGYGSFGQASPPGLTDIVAAAAGIEHSVALKKNGTLVDWGNYYGDTSGFSNIMAVAAKAFSFAVLRSNGTILDWGAFKYAGTNEVGPSNAVAICVGFAPLNVPEHGLALTREGKVQGWGDNSAGQISIPIDLPNAVSIAAGSRFSVAVIRTPQIFITPANQTLLEGSSVTLSVGAASETPLTYQWLFNGTAIPGATNCHYTLAAVALTDFGLYSVVVRNAFGAVTSRPANLSVIPLIPILTLQPASQAALQHEEIVAFHVDATGALPLRYQWRHNGIEIPGATNEMLLLYDVQDADAGAYSVLVRNDHGMATSGNAVLQVLIPDLIIDNPAALVLGDWSTGTAPERFGPDYRLKATGTGSAYVQFTPVLPRAGTYRVAEWHPGGPDHAIVVPHLISHQGGIAAVLVDQHLNGGQWNPLGTFSFDVGTAGSVRITDEAGDLGSVIADAIRFVHVPAPPLLVAQPQNQTVVVGQDAEFSVLVQGAAPWVFQWEGNGVIVVGSTNSTLRLRNVQPAQSGNYRVLVSNPDGVTVSDAATLTVATLPLRLELIGNRWRLSWDGPYTLQGAAAVTGPYVDVAGDSPFLLSAEQPQQFYRLRN
ncbi:MAG TPA: immunoglobulin domain-containing protein [Verrucomicrobiae bacterium]|nr:immunoglobulin domain-containing protein [Verrucomicrobiae bacterium]